jgi:hypothetical protein
MQTTNFAIVRHLQTFFGTLIMLSKIQKYFAIDVLKVNIKVLVAYNIVNNNKIVSSSRKNSI